MSDVRFMRLALRCARRGHGMVVASQKELGLPIKFVGLSAQPDGSRPFDAKQFARVSFEQW